eukprot:CAMPEP_0202690032 /NCGR_PEP_ID=MMETSP1385-20130828/5170_1 /ASSEMBLY_ACC=CAM_ASM_000861 /TAXON_ID=933848 /ORGANISM="Elphidium margaritaceum" /LENGTH=860 /DNA_ID=CAMNT_0049345259 /DNA_START=20 /DNA_END=2602 /DNA_ORIENTATION=-
MAAPANNSIQLKDEPNDDGTGWAFDENFSEWDHDNFKLWLTWIDDSDELIDFNWHDENHEEISGVHFTRDKLGDPSWVKRNVSLPHELCEEFAALVRKRITNYENLAAQNQPPSVGHQQQSLWNIIGVPANRAKRQSREEVKDDSEDEDDDDTVLQKAPPLQSQPEQKAPPQAYNVQYGTGTMGGTATGTASGPTPSGGTAGFTTAGNGSMLGEPRRELSPSEALSNLPIAPPDLQNTIQKAAQQAMQAQQRPHAASAASDHEFVLNQEPPPPPSVPESQSHNPLLPNYVPAESQEDIIAKYGKPPPMPFKEHPKPSNKSMSNKFRPKGPNKIMYPPKNGPIAVSKRLNIPLKQIPVFDPHDEISGNLEEQQKITVQYGNKLSYLSEIGQVDHDRNLRLLLRYEGDEAKVCDDLFEPPKFSHVYIGDRVVRGSDWKWGDQDGGLGYEGTVRGLRQWHPQDPPTVTTEVVVLWDHGLYGNYRWNYKGAFDVQVVDRHWDEKHAENLISVGDEVERKQPNWRWGTQDGGIGGIGTVIELYASPAPFEGGCRIGVLWDCDKAKYRKLAEDFLQAHPNGDEEWYDYSVLDNDEMEHAKKKHGRNHYLDTDEVLQKFYTFDRHPHQVRLKRPKYEPQPSYYANGQNPYDSDENSEDWDEPDFDEVLCRPIPKYRWCLSDPKSEFGSANDVTICQSKPLAERNYLMIDDRVRRTEYFRARRKPPNSEHGIVLKVEQADPRRVLAHEIKGDRVFTTWSTYQPYSFQSNDGADEIAFYKRGQVFGDPYSRIKVGDRVQRGVTWKSQWGDEDGGHEAKGTVVCVQYVLQVVGTLAKVRWEKTGHTNFYSWGFKDVFDLKKAHAGAQEEF